MCLNTINCFFFFYSFVTHSYLPICTVHTIIAAAYYPFCYQTIVSLYNVCIRLIMCTNTYAATNISIRLIRVYMRQMHLFHSFYPAILELLANSVQLIVCRSHNWSGHQSVIISLLFYLDCHFSFKKSLPINAKTRRLHIRYIK